MAFSNKLNEVPAKRLAANSRNGTVSIVTLFAVFGILVLIAYVGNSGHAVHQKIETQNASDTIAFTSAQWKARGMNSITATNHMLGEVTAILTIHEAMGGPEVDAGIEATTVESQILDNLINNMKSFAPVRGLPTYGITPAVTQVDQDFLNFVANRVAADNGNHRAFATIYDSKITLKKKFAALLVAKGIANLGLFVPPPWGYGTAAVALAVHIGATVKIAGITKEWLILSAMEEIAIQTKNLKVSILEEQLVPALAAHADLIANTNMDSTNTLQGGLVGHAINNSIEEMQTSIKLSTFPRSFAIKLPVESEPGPSLQGGPNEPEWAGNSSDDEDSLKIDVMKIVRDHQKQTKKIESRISRLRRDISALDKQEEEVDDELKLAPPESELEKELEEEKELIEELRTKKRKEIARRQAELAKLKQEFGKTMQNIQKFQSVIGGQGGNLSDSPQHLPAELNQRQERYSQWVRATWPYVDAMRAPILAQFENQLKQSNAKKHYIKWTNRYALVKSWQFRSGYRFKKTGGQSGRWTQSNDVEPLTMYVLKDAFDRSGNEQKGREPWTKADPDGKKSAEQMFTLLGFAQRNFEAKFAPKVFQQPHENGMSAYAQAILYNANPQKQTTSARSLIQPTAGWDTLNWDPDTETPEWGSEPAVGDAKWPWQVISSARQTDSVKVKLNWQAKLMPATKSRITEAAIDNAASDLGKTLGKSALHFEHMSSH